MNDAIDTSTETMDTSADSPTEAVRPAVWDVLALAVIVGLTARFGWYAGGAVVLVASFLRRARILLAVRWCYTGGRYVVGTAILLAAVIFGIDQYEKWIERKKVRAIAASKGHLSGSLSSEWHEIRFHGSHVTDDHLRHMTDVRDVVSLQIHNTSVHGPGLANISHWSNLRTLQVHGSPLTDEGLTHLKDFRNLEIISLRGTKVTDAGIKHLVGLNRLSALDLSSTAVSDVGLQELAQLKGLRFLILQNTQVTDAGVKAFQRAVPGCNVAR